jgi:UDP-N-acetylmuramoyl-L-alanyl-D-glutamate--2,6-diaminopimelate ligase
MTIVNQIKTAVKKAVPKSVLSGYHFAMAFLAAAYCRFPSRKLKVIGVTGTNGKSTTIEMVAAILKEAGYRVALSSSIRFEVAGEERKNWSGNSMPGRCAMQRFLAQAAKAKCDYALIEVTSEGIVQHRHRFIKFEGAVFTNLTPEHIEAHGGFDNYRKAKQRLFRAAKGFHVINCDDQNAGYFLKFKPKKKFCYSLSPSVPQGCDNCETLIVQNVAAEGEGVEFVVNGKDFKLNLAGQFNIYNALAAIGAAMSQGIGLDVCQKALAKISSIPGRMEKVHSSPDIFVDYAFTPNALEKVYATLKKDLPPGARLICLLGACGGGRDKWKRPVLGQIAARWCDRIILANEDPFDEDPQAIISMIKEGVEKENFPKGNLHLIIDRRQAISQALALAGPRDKVILTGKGCEPWIRVKRGQKIAWDEKIVVLEELARLDKK